MRRFLLFFLLGGLLLLPVMARADTVVCGTYPNGLNILCTNVNESCQTVSDCNGYGGGTQVGTAVCDDGGQPCPQGDNNCNCYLDPNRLTAFQNLPSVLGIGPQLSQPNLEINFPGLSFTNVTNTIDANGNLHIPFIGDFIGALYKIALVFGTILAVIFVIVAGVQVILSAGGEEKIAAYKRIGQIIIGLVILWGSYAILYTINPALTVVPPLGLEYIPPVASVPLSIISPQVYQKITGQLPASKAQIISLAVTAGTNAGFTDPCIMKSILAKESGAQPNVVGHDSDYTGRAKVPSRKSFLLSGVKYSGTTFTALNPQTFNPLTDNATPIFDDDGSGTGLNRGIVDSPPDYGLDWRFSFGFGLGQITLFPKPSTYYPSAKESRCPDGERGIAPPPWTGHCYTIPELLTADKNLAFTATLAKYFYDQAGNLNLTGNNQIMGMFKGYASGVGSLKTILANTGGNSTAIAAALANDPSVARAMHFYSECAAQSNSVDIGTNPSADPVDTDNDDSSD